MTDAQLIQLWNLLFPDNDSREISEKDLRDGLIAFLNTLSTRIGSLPSLQTNQKTSIVLAINELVSRIGNLENRFEPQFGDTDPNQVPPPNPFDYGSIYIQQENQGGNIVDIAFWIYTNVSPGWLNLSDFLQPIIKLEFEPNEIYNFPAAKKGQSFGIKINDGNNDLPNGYALLGGPLGVYIGNDTLLFALQDSPNGNFADVGGNFLIINGLKEQVIVNELPATGLEVQTYVRQSDNTLWRWTAGGTVQYPTPQFVQIGESQTPVTLDAVLFTPQDLTLEQQGIARDNQGISSTFKQLFNYSSTTNPTKSFQLNFIPTSVVYLTDTNSFLQGSDVGKTDYSIDTETAILTINVALKDSAEIIICYEHQNQNP